MQYKEKIMRIFFLILCTALLAVSAGCATPGETGSATTGQDSSRPTGGYRGGGGGY
jgi:hypothetical protein